MEAVQPRIVDPRKALLDLLNLEALKDAFYGTDGKDTAAEAFISRHGNLRRMPPLETYLETNFGVKADKIQPVRTAAAILQGMIGSIDKGSGPLSAVNLGLGLIFGPIPNADGKDSRPAILPDILAEKLEISPRDSLDSIAVEFMSSFKKIGRCTRCRRFFLRVYGAGNDRYCSPRCAEVSRKEAQRDWMRTYRAERKRKAKPKEAKRRAS